MDGLTESQKNSPALDVFAGGGEMGELMRASFGGALLTHDWSNTPLGAIATWSPSLRTAVGICLSSPVPSCVIWGREFVLLYNDGYRSLIGDNHPQANGRPIQENGSEFWHHLRPILEDVLQTGQPAYFANDLQPIEPDRALQAAHYSFSPIFDETGQVAGIFHAAIRAMPNCEATIALASETEQLEDSTLKQLRESEAKYRTLLDSIDEGYCVLEMHIEPGEPLNFRYIETNQAFEQQSTLINAQGRWMRELRPDYEESWYEIYRDVALTGKPIRFELSSTELEDRWFSLYAFRIGQPDERRVGVLFYDISERKQAEQAKTVFLSNVSHEFRTPLTLLLGPLQDVLSDTTHTLAPPQREHLELARRNAIRLLKLVNTLLDFSRIEADRIQAIYEPTDLATLTAELASVFRSAIERAKLHFVVDCPSLPEPIYVARKMWEKIVLNLISNAFKFTFTGTITIRLYLAGNQVELAVQDTGIGIPAAEIPHLFERFYRVKGAQGRTFEGSGIGLSLVQELVKLHGGRVEVSSVEGEGSCFRVLIPTGCTHLPGERIGRTLASTATGASSYVEEALRWLTQESREAGEERSTPLDSDPPLLFTKAPALKRGENILKVPLSFSKFWGSEATPKIRALFKGDLGGSPSLETVPTPSSARILLVDDNADMRDYLKRLLSERWQVETAANGAIAINLIQKQLPDLVLTDVMMPEVDGFQLLRALRADPVTKSIPIILLSARAGEEATVEGLEAGADD